MSESIIPKIKLNAERLALKATHRGAMAVDSELPGTNFLYNDLNVMIVTNQNGYLVVKRKNIDTFIAELQGIREVLLT